MSDHYPFETLLDFVEGRLAGDELKEIEAHLDLGCGACATEISAIQRMALALEANRWPLPTPLARQAVIGAFKSNVDKRKRRRRTLRYGIAGGAVILLVLFAVIGPWSSGVGLTTSIVEVSGPVTILLNDQSTEVTAFEGQELPIGASIQTGSGASATLSFPSGDRVMVGQNSAVSIEKLSKDENVWQVAIHQTRGRTENIVDPRSSEYRVQTELGEIMAVGTRFVVEIEKCGAIQVSVSEGEVQASSATNVVFVPAGKMAYFAAGQGVSLAPLESPTPETEVLEPPAPGPTPPSDLSATSDPEADDLTPEPSEISDGAETPEDE